MKSLLLFTLASVSMLACAKSPIEDPIKAITQAAEYKGAMGKFVERDCAASSGDTITEKAKDIFGSLFGDTKPKSSRKSITITGDGIVKSEELYADNNCQQKLYAVSLSGTIAIESDSHKFGNDGSRPVDIKYTTVEITAFDAGVDLLNKNNRCSNTGWQNGKAVNVTDHAADHNCINQALPVEQANRIVVQEDRILYVGSDGHAVIKHEDRPSTTPSTPYIKQ